MKLLICEDDVSTINVLKKKIDFKKYGIDKIIEAYNGEMAIDIIKKENPELIFCDIGMPKVNGTEVLKFARSYDKKTQFVFLTCYEDFKYAKLALDYEAAGYITKPFKLKQIEDALKKMTDNYRENNENVNEEGQIKKDLVSSSVFRQISDGAFGDNKDLIQNFLDNNEINIKADSKWKIVFSCMSILNTPNSDWSLGLLLYTAARVHDEILNNYVGSAHTIVNNDDRFLWCITFVDANIDDKQLKERCEVLDKFCKEHFSIEPVMLISNEFALFNAASICNDLYAIIRKIRFYGGKVFHQNDKIDVISSRSLFSENQLLWYLKNKDESGYEEYINNVIENSEKINNLENLKKEILMFFLTIIKDNNIPSSIINDDEKLNKYNMLELNKSNLLSYCKQLMHIYNGQINNMSDSEKIIYRAKQFLDDNYRENIDRDDVAEVAYVTPNYLSKLFRNSMGINLREYINQLRIEESKRLLLSTNMSVSEVACYVGYDNISYFSTVFHKLVGVSPSDWKTSGKEIK